MCRFYELYIKNLKTRESTEGDFTARGDYEFYGTTCTMVGNLDDFVGGEVFGDYPDTCGDVVFIGLDVDFRLFGGFIWCGDTSEIYVNNVLLAGIQEIRKGCNVPLISPARAFLYKPLGSRCSTTLRGAST